jgi:methylated-DNA-protein-cysteine methyltransferase-like protein
MGFYSEVYEIVSKIPKGKVLTYGIIAKMIGRPRMSRQVGWALHSNSHPDIVPCHRVVNRNGGLASSFAFGGPEIQKMLLVKEGVEVNDDNTIDLDKYLYKCSYENMFK